MALNDRHFIDEFSRALDEIEKTTPMRGGYERIEPEIHNYEQGGHRFRILNFHLESRDWYKPNMVEWSLTHMHAANFVRQNDIVFDLGCNSGFLTTWFAMQAPRGHVYAFDPFPWNAAATRVQAKLNGLNNVTVHAVGIGPIRKKISVPAVSSSTLGTTSVQGTPAIKIQIEPLKKFSRAKPTFIKIDIEGAEHELGPEIVRSGVQRGYIEMHPKFIENAGGQVDAVLQDLEKAHFDIAFHAPGHIPWKSPDPVEAGGYYFERNSIPPRKWWRFWPD